MSSGEETPRGTSRENDIDNGESEIRRARGWDYVEKVDASVPEVVAELLKMELSEIQERRRVEGEARDRDTEVGGKAGCGEIEWRKKLGGANGGLKLINMRRCRRS